MLLGIISALELLNLAGKWKQETLELLGDRRGRICPSAIPRQGRALPEGSPGAAPRLRAGHTRGFAVGQRPGGTRRSLRQSALRQRTPDGHRGPRRRTAALVTGQGDTERLPAISTPSADSVSSPPAGSAFSLLSPHQPRAPLRTEAGAGAGAVGLHGSRRAGPEGSGWEPPPAPLGTGPGLQNRRTAPARGCCSPPPPSEQRLPPGRRERRAAVGAGAGLVPTRGGAQRRQHRFVTHQGLLAALCERQRSGLPHPPGHCGRRLGRGRRASHPRGSAPGETQEQEGPESAGEQGRGSPCPAAPPLRSCPAAAPAPARRPRPPSAATHLLGTGRAGPGPRRTLRSAPLGAAAALPPCARPARPRPAPRPPRPGRHRLPRTPTARRALPVPLPLQGQRAAPPGAAPATGTCRVRLSGGPTAPPTAAASAAHSKATPKRRPRGQRLAQPAGPVPHPAPGSTQRRSPGAPPAGLRSALPTPPSHRDTASGAFSVGPTRRRAGTSSSTPAWVEGPAVPRAPSPLGETGKGIKGTRTNPFSGQVHRQPQHSPSQPESNRLARQVRREKLPGPVWSQPQLPRWPVPAGSLPAVRSPLQVWLAQHAAPRATRLSLPSLLPAPSTTSIKSHIFHAEVSGEPQLLPSLSLFTPLHRLHTGVTHLAKLVISYTMSGQHPATHHPEHGSFSVRRAEQCWGQRSAPRAA